MATRQASTAGELGTALNASAAGDIIELENGSYGGINVSNVFASPGVTIQAASGNNPTISTITCSGQNVTFKNLEVICGAQVAGSNSGAIRVTSTGRNIIFDGCTAKGPVQGAYAGGYAVNFESGSDGCQFKFGSSGQLRIGLVCIGSTNCYVGYNTFLTCGEDGMKGFGNNFTVEYNLFPTSYSGDAGDHPDGIQCQNSVSGGYIGYNIIPGGPIQGIWFGGPNQVVTNLTIEQNIVFGQLNNGIALKSGVGASSSNVTISHNTVGFWRASSAKKATYIAWSGDNTSPYNVEFRDVSPGPGFVNGKLSLSQLNPDSTYGINNYYANLRHDYPHTPVVANFTPVPGALTDFTTNGTNTYGAYDLINQWIAADGVWPPGAVVTEPPATNPPKNPVSFGNTVLHPGGSPLIF